MNGMMASGMSVDTPKMTATTTLSTNCDFSIFFAVRRSNMNMVFIARLLSA